MIEILIPNRQVLKALNLDRNTKGIELKGAELSSPNLLLYLGHVNESDPESWQPFSYPLGWIFPAMLEDMHIRNAAVADASTEAGSLRIAIEPLDGCDDFTPTTPVGDERPGG